MTNAVAYEDRRSLRRLLRLALHPKTNIKYNEKWSIRIENRLQALAAFSTVDKSAIPKIKLDCLTLYCQHGYPVDAIALQMTLSPLTVDNYIRDALDFIVDHMNEKVLHGFHPTITQWRLKGCSHCGGDLQWDAEGAYDPNEGDYVCLQCGMRYDVENLPRILNRS